MLDTLNFVRGSVSTKDVVPILKAFHVYDGRIQGTNGRLTIDAPCPELKGMNFTAPAEAFLKAVDACDGEPSLKIADQKLTISRGKFKATLPLEEHDEFPRIAQDGVEGVAVGSLTLLKELRALQTFIGDDAQRLWQCGILFRDGQAFATNNVIFASIPAYRFPSDINLPDFAVTELLRLNLPVTHFRANQNSVSFEFPNGAWLRSSLYNLDWPDISRFMSAEVKGTKISADLISGIRKILPFCPDPKNPVILFTGEEIATMDGNKNAAISGFPLPRSGWRAEPLLSVLIASSEVDFSAYPQPCPFKGNDGLRGVIVGYRI